MVHEHRAAQSGDTAFRGLIAKKLGCSPACFSNGASGPMLYAATGPLNNSSYFY